MRSFAMFSVLVAALLVGVGCGSKDPSGPTTGGLKVWVVADGPDAGGYLFTVMLDGGGSRSVTAEVAAEFTDLTPGTYVVRLEGMPTNCHMDASNAQSISVVAGSTASTTFMVACDAWVAGRWNYRANLDLGVDCTVNLSLSLTQVAGSFGGTATSGRLICPEVGLDEYIGNGRVVNGVSDRHRVEFDIDDPSWHQSGTYSGSSMGGGVVLQFEDGTSLSGSWDATRTSSVVLDQVTGEGVALVALPSLSELVERIRRTTP